MNKTFKRGFMKTINKIIFKTAALVLATVILGAGGGYHYLVEDAHADSASASVYNDESEVDIDSNFSIHVEEVNALELTLSETQIEIDLAPDISRPDFDSEDLRVIVGTSNTTGYSLIMTPSYNNVVTTDLTRTEAIGNVRPTIATLSSTVTPAIFASDSDTTTTNKWGYMVTTTNLSVDKTVYSPMLTSNVVNRNTTVTPGDYTDLTFGAKVDSTTPAGSYLVTLNFNATVNPVTYSIAYNIGNNSDEGNIVLPSPNPQTGALASSMTTSVPISSTMPTRVGYAFGGWCTVMPTTANNSDSCVGGTTYGAGNSIDIALTEPDVTLYAMWNISSFSCAKQYRLQNADGTYPSSYTSVTGEDLPYGSTCTYEQAMMDYTTQSTTGTVGVNGVTLSLDLPRTTYALTVDKDSTYIDSVTGAGTYRWGETVTITATEAANSEFTTWEQTAGTTSSFADATSASTTFTMPKSAATVKANGKTSLTTFAQAYAAANKSQSGGYYTMQDMTSSICAAVTVGQTATLRDTRDTTDYLVAKAADENCWMLQNLKLGSNSTSLSLTTANSTVSSSGFTLSNKLSDGKFPRASSTSGTDAYYQYDGSAYYCTSDYGCYYNWYTATAGSGTGSVSSGNVSYSICPKGWNLPTGGSNGQFQTLYNQYNSASLMLVDSPTSTKDNTAGKIPGFLLGGYYNASGASNVGSSGYYWSRTASSARYGYNLFLNTSGVNPTDNNYKYYGRAVRCVAV